MRAFQLHEYTGPAGLRLVDVPPPEADNDHVLVDVRAIGVNFPDLLLTRGQYQLRPELPTIPGCEIAGVVVHAPKGSGVDIGDRVAAFVWQGGFAERVAVPFSGLMPVPDTVDLASAAAIVVNYHTVHFALERRGGLRAGDHVLVLGAAGGIGTAATQVAQGLGAHVIAGVADHEQAQVAAEAGADEVLILDEGFSTTVRQRTAGRGVDVVLDPLGDWLFDEGLRSLAPEGRILVVGFAAGAIPELRVNRLLLRNASAVGVAFGAFLEVEPELMARQSRSLASMVEHGTVRPALGVRYAFHDLPAALHRLERGEVPGKAVVEL